MTKTKPLIEELYEFPYEFDFFQAVQILERADPSREPVGMLDKPDREAVRFRSLPSLSFPPSQIADLLQNPPPVPKPRPGQFAPPPEMTIAFFGLIGPDGALPTVYTEQVLYQLARGRQDERTALRDWLDMFNHRLIAQFYQSWEKYQCTVPFLRYIRSRHASQGGLSSKGSTGAISIALQQLRREPDPFSMLLFSHVGLAPARLRNRIRVSVPQAIIPGAAEDEIIDLTRLVNVDDFALLYYAGLFAQRPRNVTNLAAVVMGLFGYPLKVLQFSGQWLSIPPDQRCSLTDDGCATLGFNAVAGERVWDVISSFRLRLGPLDLKSFQNLLPDKAVTPRRKTFFLLCQVVRLFVGPEFDFEVQLVLAGPEIPECQLVEGGRETIGARLGWNTWLKDGPMGDSDDVYFAADDTTELKTVA